MPSENIQRHRCFCSLRFRWPSPLKTRIKLTIMTMTECHCPNTFVLLYFVVYKLQKMLNTTPHPPQQSEKLCIWSTLMPFRLQPEASARHHWASRPSVAEMALLTWFLLWLPTYKESCCLQLPASLQCHLTHLSPNLLTGSVPGSVFASPSGRLVEKDAKCKTTLPSAWSLCLHKKERKLVSTIQTLWQSVTL